MEPIKIQLFFEDGTTVTIPWGNVPDTAKAMLYKPSGKATAQAGASMPFVSVPSPYASVRNVR